jgi:hypothetical protein
VLSILVSSQHTHHNYLFLVTALHPGNRTFVVFQDSVH